MPTDTDVPLNQNALAANWDPEILKAYLDSVEKDHEVGAGIDDEEAISTDEEEEEEESSSVSSIFSMSASQLAFHRPSDIASSDSAFSSEDEFGDDDDGVREEQLTRRELVLGRPTAQILGMRGREMREMQEGYMKQLDDADVEIAELTGEALVVVQRRRSDELEVVEKVDG